MDARTLNRINNLSMRYPTRKIVIDSVKSKIIVIGKKEKLFFNFISSDNDKIYKVKSSGNYTEYSYKKVKVNPVYCLDYYPYKNETIQNYTNHWKSEVYFITRKINGIDHRIVLNSKNLPCYIESLDCKIIKFIR